MHFGDRLYESVRRLGNPIVVGIDPRPEQLPAGLRESEDPSPTGIARTLEVFGREVLDVVASRVPAVKFQMAFYERYGPEGLGALQATARRARELGLVVILDGKRNDIGSTAEAYAQAYLGGAEPGGQAVWDTDSLTINAYLSRDGVDPFVRVARENGRGLFILVRTSNPSAGDFQDRIAEGKPLYRHVAERVREWAMSDRGDSGYSLTGAVVGATYPEQLAELREVMPGVIFLVPGYGAQGGTAKDVASAFDADGLGAIINSSRGITFAYQRPEYRDRFGKNWQGAVEEAVRVMADDLAENTPAGRLRG